MSTPTQPRRLTETDDASSAPAVLVAVQTTFRHMSTSPAVADHVAKEAQKLQRYYDRITHCHVVITAPHQHHRHGRQFSIHVELGVPHGPIVVNHEPGALPSHTGASREVHREPDAAHEEIYVTVRETFDIVRRRL